MKMMYTRIGDLGAPKDFEFPFTPYKIQQQLMQELYKILENRQIGILESPTGTGKSLTLTCAALKWLEDHERQTKHELEERLEQLTKELNEMEKKGSKAKDWFEMHAETSGHHKQLMQLKEINKLLKDYEGKLTYIREKHNTNVEYVCKRDNKLPAFATNKVEDESVLLEGAAIELNDDEDDNDDINESENNYRPVQIYFCSRTHTQLAQVVREIKRTIYGTRVRCISLASRQQMCINKQVRSLNNLSLINERCVDLATNIRKNSKTTCFTQDGCTKKKAKTVEQPLASCLFKSQVLVNKLSELSLYHNLDIEDLVNEGEQLRACPYYASRKSVRMAQIVMLPYQLLLHRKSRLQTGINLKGNIIIIDEAHNLLDTIAQMHSCELNLQQLQAAQQQVLLYKMRYASQFSASNLLNINQILFIIKQLLKLLKSNKSCSGLTETRLLYTYELMSEGDFFNINVYELIQFCERTRFAQKLQGFVKNSKYKDMSQINENQQLIPTSSTVSILKRLEDQRQGVRAQKKVQHKSSPEQVADNIVIKDNMTSPIRPLMTFLESLTEKADDGRILISIATEASNDFEVKTSFKYLLLNPGAHFQDVVDEARAIIIAGGTMQPTEELTEQLFRKCPERVKVHCYDHVVPPNAVLPFVVVKGPSGRSLCFNYMHRATTEMLNDLTLILKNLSNVIPAGLVCFVPSYDYLDLLYNHLQVTGALENISSKKRVFKEPHYAANKEDSCSIEQLLSDYAKSIRLRKGGALLLSVVGAKLSEGLNFTDDLGRGVIVVGLPYPNHKSPELQERMLYLDETLHRGAGQEYYENLCMKAVNQCIGRAVRHIDDYACVYLLDERYNREHLKEKLPQWISRNLKVCNNYGEVQGGTVKFFKQHK